MSRRQTFRLGERCKDSRAYAEVSKRRIRKKKCFYKDNLKNEIVKKIKKNEKL